MPRLRIRPLVGVVLVLIVLGSAAYALSAARLGISIPAPTLAPAVASDAAKLQARVASGAPAAAAVPAASPAAAPASVTGNGAAAVAPDASAPLEVQAQSVQPLDRMV